MSFKTRLHRLGENMERLSRGKKLIEDYDLDLDPEGDDQQMQGMLSNWDDEINETDFLDDDEEFMDEDAIDKSLGRVVKELIDDGLIENQASDAVYNALSDLVDSGVIEDTPDIDVDDDEKAEWIANAIPKIKEKLYLDGVLHNYEADEFDDV